MSNEGLEEIVERLDYNEAYGFSEKNVQYEEFEKGLSENVVRKISAMKSEPEWMLQKRLTGYKIFESKPMPKWGADLSKIDFSDFYPGYPPSALFQPFRSHLRLLSSGHPPSLKWARDALAE